MPKSLEITLKFENDIPLPTGARTRVGSIASQVKEMKIGQSVLLDNKNHFTSFNNAIRKHRSECMVKQQVQPDGKIRAWLVAGTIEEKTPELSSAATK